MKKINYTLIILFGLGNIILLFSRKFSTILTDFELGFCEGIAVVFIAAGAIYMCWNAFSKSPAKV